MLFAAQPRWFLHFPIFIGYLTLLGATDSEELNELPGVSALPAHEIENPDTEYIIVPT